MADDLSAPLGRKRAAKDAAPKFQLSVDKVPLARIAFGLAAVVLLGIVAWWTAPHLTPLPKVEGAVTLNQVRTIVGQRCVTCHSPSPTFPGIAQPPAGVMLQNSASLAQNAQRIYQQVVVTRIMPLGNATQMTDYERAVIAAWIADGAPAK